jgi:Domain of unknown function (DUF4157)
MKARVPIQSRPPRRTPACEPEGAERRANGWGLADNRPAAVAQRQLADGINAGATQQVMRVAREALQNSPRMTAQRMLAAGLPAKPQAVQRVEDEESVQAKSAVTQRAEDEELLQGKSDSIQRREPEEEEPLQGRFVTVQRLPEPARPVNRTGLPDTLKTGIESLSGLSMDHVKVHYNSAQPAQLNALAYAQGRDIHLAPGQEQHLPHEAWHVVQQAQGRVRPTMQLKDGVPVNDDQGLEHEADVMGARSARQPMAERAVGAPQDGWPEAAMTSAIQRMAVNNTDWAAASQVKVNTKGGTGGVFIFNDGGEPVVVKPGQQLAAEILVAATLGNAVLGESDENQWTIGTPQARAASPEEAGVIKARATALLGADAAEDRTQEALDTLDNPTSVVFAYAAGSDFSELLVQSKHTKKKLRSGRTVRPESAVATLWRDAGPLTLLGQASAVDIFMGNGDRLVMLINPDNWKVDQGQRAINLIDNVHESAQGVFELEEGDYQYIQAWLQKSWVTNFVQGNLATIAHDTIERLSTDLLQHMRDEDLPLMTLELQAQAQQMKQWFGSGLQQGKDKLMSVLDDPDALVAGVPLDKRKNALRSVHARRLLLSGHALVTAIVTAQNLVP